MRMFGADWPLLTLFISFILLFMMKTGWKVQEKGQNLLNKTNQFTKSNNFIIFGKPMKRKQNKDLE